MSTCFFLFICWLNFFIYFSCRQKSGSASSTNQLTSASNSDVENITETEEEEEEEKGESQHLQPQGIKDKLVVNLKLPVCFEHLKPIKNIKRK